MRFRFSLLAFVIVLVFGLSSCEECIDCQYRYEDPETKDTLTFKYDEFCGNSDEVDGFKKRAKREAREVDGKLNCQTENKYFW
jgi:hypothetical protein